MLPALRASYHHFLQLGSLEIDTVERKRRCLHSLLRRLRKICLLSCLECWFGKDRRLDLRSLPGLRLLRIFMDHDKLERVVELQLPARSEISMKEEKGTRNSCPKSSPHFATFLLVMVPDAFRLSLTNQI
jgi:hypothetical protein